MILEQIGRQTIVSSPEANNHMNVHPFVYNSHFPAITTFSTISGEGYEPELLYTNTFHGSFKSHRDG